MRAEISSRSLGRRACDLVTISSRWGGGHASRDRAETGRPAYQGIADGGRGDTYTHRHEDAPVRRDVPCLGSTVSVFVNALTIVHSRGMMRPGDDVCRCVKKSKGTATCFSFLRAGATPPCSAPLFDFVPGRLAISHLHLPGPGRRRRRVWGVAAGGGRGAAVAWARTLRLVWYAQSTRRRPK